jgi:predicted alpha/beta-hydrolase family hydrolase
VLEIPTPAGPARAQCLLPPGARAALVLGHGAGGGVGAPDLTAVSRAAQALELAVVLVEQPYRVAGRRTPPPAPRLDDAWVAVLERLRLEELAGLALVAGGRSSGARVACRTAVATGAVGVLCLSFPLHPPGRAGTVSRLDELDGVPVPTLVVQGERDPFGMPPPGRNRTIVRVAGDHSLKQDLDTVAAAATEWLAKLTRRSTRGGSRTS